MKICKFTIDSEGTVFWHNKNDLLHREGDKPAIIRKDGSKWWYKNGKRHREGDKPAVILKNGLKEWWKDGKFIREFIDIKTPNIDHFGTKRFFNEDGQLHRDGDQPAVIFVNGIKEWYKNGKQLSEEEVKLLTTPSHTCENTIIEINNEKFKLVKV